MYVWARKKKTKCSTSLQHISISHVLSVSKSNMGQLDRADNNVWDFSAEQITKEN